MTGYVLRSFEYVSVETRQRCIVEMSSDSFSVFLQHLILSEGSQCPVSCICLITCKPAFTSLILLDGYFYRLNIS